MVTNPFGHQGFAGFRARFKKTFGIYPEPKHNAFLRAHGIKKAKTRWLCFGPQSSDQFFFQGKLIERCSVYKYLGMEFSSNLSWNQCIKSRIASGLRALFALRSKCEVADLVAWPLRRHLFDSLVKTVVLYGTSVWGPALSPATWSQIESIHKLFLQYELGVRVQIPYVLLLAETGRLPLEIDVLELSIQYAIRVGNLRHERYSRDAWIGSSCFGWFANLRKWAEKWDFPEQDWEPVNTLRSRLTAVVIQKLWSSPTPRQEYYKRDINRLDKYSEPDYLCSMLPRRTKRLIARYKLSSHSLRSEEGRWTNIPRGDRICRLCDLNSIENEYHTPSSVEVRAADSAVAVGGTAVGADGDDAEFDENDGEEEDNHGQAPHQESVEKNGGDDEDDPDSPSRFEIREVFRAPVEPVDGGYPSEGQRLIRFIVEGQPSASRIIVPQPFVQRPIPLDPQPSVA
ncbi:hypothetical protein R1sor_010485 [Riccia sorocarpa]|uniref:Uncharacterized protein n=1 Tax=Riccia sorocarpa TaxID=122646 RepID=A0ABD3I4A0_9MARC